MSSSVVPGLSLGRQDTDDDDDDGYRVLYQNILRLRDRLLEGKVPSIPIPLAGSVSKQISPAVNGTGGHKQNLPHSQSIVPPPPQHSNSSRAPQSSISSINATHIPQNNYSYAQQKLLQRPVIDPVLLQKSPELIRAEMSIEKQKIDRALISEFDARPRIRGRQEAGEDVELDLETLLSQTHIQVPPILVYRSAEDTVNDSFDENSYYSSKADSWSTHSKDAEDGAESDAMAISEEGEISEGEFEPQTASAYNSTAANAIDRFVPQSASAPTVEAAVEEFEPELEDEPYEPAANVENVDLEEVYSPPAPISSPPSQVQHHTQPSYNPQHEAQAQLLQAFFGGQAPLPPHTVAVNQIETLAAPQPSHISPLATGALQANFDVQDPSSRSDPDQTNKNVRTPKESNKRKRKNNKIKNNGKNGSAKKQRLVQSQSPDPIIKAEPITPPLPFGSPLQTPVQKRKRLESPNGPDFRPPPGYRLVPIEGSDFHPEPAYHQPAPPILARPVFRDARGNEFYAEPPLQHYRPVPIPGPAHVPRYYEPAHPYDAYQPVQRATTHYEHTTHPGYGETGQAAAPYPIGARPQRYVEYHAPRAGTAAPPAAHPAPAERAYSVHPATRPDPYAPRELEYVPARPTQAYIAHPGYGEYAPPPRAYSSYQVAAPGAPQPQSVADPYRTASVAPSRGPQVQSRAVSVYPQAYAPQGQYQSEHPPGEYAPRDAGRGMQPPPRY
jgi:hypothetical protein